ncbi:glutamine-hydrolyzing carbamoyl-phosphate synthase small subunit [Methylocystis sp. Sn-Cys]|uniref:glutamine-hydrolyzing carbamoyl-phosphate synthase small subunit n=1 Tax=Methylocystis sp. Sn-Cys TaxID=1701263 RepID=UPI0019236821|nr:glutamine-hydrolyzing carbamoyl-phosphate synthase small subunit [Methylocystis sp. Sn-Cys]MBL1258434.1 glutamine-hydrolyzing carbamoyl-phosphate synthase small subunit [Methylocystis sp. Sn-Cys]
MTLDQDNGWTKPVHTGVLVLASGEVIEGFGLGAVGEAVGEVCFNTAMTGYEEILTDPSYAAQIVTFTFPHIGNVGANGEDIETVDLARSAGAVGAIFGQPVTDPSNFRSETSLTDWLAKRGIVALYGVDTRALTALIRERGMPNAVIAYAPDGKFDIEALKAKAAAWPGIDGMDLVPSVGAKERYDWKETPWRLGAGYGARDGAAKFRVVAIDYGVKRNILRLLAEEGCEVIVAPATATSVEILALKPDGVFLSNGPGDPAETGKYATPVIRDLLAKRVPVFGICLGHQMMALAVGAKTQKMPQGHHGANHPVKDFTTGKVEIVSMNHGFAVDRDSLPANAVETHRSLFDGSNCGIALTDRPAFSVQHHPEASPGPQDSHYLFKRFVEMMEKAKAA